MVREEAAEALGKIEIDAEHKSRVIETLVSASSPENEESWKVRSRVVKALGREGLFTDLARSALEKAAREDPYFRVRKMATKTIAAHQKTGTFEADSGQPVRIESLIGDLESPDLNVKWDAVLRLGEMGAEATPAISPLKAILEQESEGSLVRVKALIALGKIEGKLRSGVARRHLDRALQSEDRDVRDLAVSIVSNIGVPSSGKLRLGGREAARSP